MNSLASQLPLSGNFGALEFPTFKKWLISVHDHIVPHERNNYHPHVLSHRMMALLSILVLSVKIASVSVIAFTPANPTDAAAITVENIVSLANSARVENGLPELKTSNLLSKAAQNKANDMLAKQYFSHNTPSGETPWTFIKAVGYSYTTAGENLAIDFTQAENVQAAWMNSPGHRANIVNNSFTEIGIGIASGTFDNHQTTIVVQMFGTPLNAPVTLQPEPTQVAQPAPAPAPAPAPKPTTVVAPAPQSAPAPASPAPAPTNTNQTPSVPADVPQEAFGPAVNVVPQGESLQIFDTKTSLQGDNLYIEVIASKNAVKLLAFYGNRSSMLDPVAEGVWKGVVPLSSIGPSDNLSIMAQDINGQMHQQPVAQFSNSFDTESYGNVEGAQVSLFGTTFNLKFWEEKIYLFILAGLLSVLVIAIAVKRHIQHMSLVANTSFVAMLIAMMLII